jgi:hypothetical protein
VQTAFTKLYLAWHRVQRHGQLDRYVRQIITRSFLDDRRRPWRREHPTDRPAERPGAGYTTPAEPVVTDSGGQGYQVQGTQVVSNADTGQNNGVGWFVHAGTDVYQGTAAGSVAVSVTTSSGPVPDGDVCRLSVAHQGTEQTCQTVMVGQTRVRVAVRELGRSGRIWYATVFRDGYTTQVQEGQNGLRPNSTILTTLPYSPEQLAQLATEPAFAFQP